MDDFTRKRGQRVHLTYLDRDGPFATEVEFALAQTGIACSRSAISPDSAPNDEEIIADIRDASALVLFCTEESLRDRHFRQEMQLAWRFERPIVPILLEPLLFPDDVAYWLEGAQWIEAFDREDAWPEELLRALTAHGLRPTGIDANEKYIPVHRSTVSLPRTEIPAPAGRLVGREEELLALSRQLANHRLVTLTGPGGTGKTRLTIDLAHLVRPLFPDGVFFVELGATSDPLAVPEFIARKLRVEPFAGESFGDATLRSLRNRRLLLVLDNFEQVLDAATFVSRILWECPDVSVLITSRASTGVAGEIEFELGPLDLPEGPGVMPVAELSRIAAVEFFVERAKAANPGFALTDTNAPDVARLCAALDGLPLAMELMAGKAKVLTPGQMLQRFASTTSILSIEGAPDRPDRHRTLRKTIEWSVNLLSAEQRTVFGWFGVFSGGATLDAIESVFERVDVPNRPDALEVLESLVQQHLVTRLERPGAEPRFRMLESIHAYAREALESSDDAADLRSAHATVYLDLLAGACEGLTGSDQASWLNHLDADYENCRTAVEWAFEIEPQRLLDAVNGLWLYWTKRGGLHEGLKWIQRSAGNVAVENPETGSRLLNIMGNMACDLGDFALAESYFLQCIDISKTLEHRAREAAAVLGIGHVFQYRGNYDDARSHYETALSTARRLDDLEFVAICVDSMGDTWAAEGNFDRALQLHKEALEILSKLRDTGALGYSYCRLGDGAFRTCDLSASRQLLADALSLFEETGDIVGSSHAQLLLSRVERADGNIDSARDLLQKALLTRLRERMTLLIVQSIEEVAITEHRSSQTAHSTLLLSVCDRQRSAATCPATPVEAKALAGRREELRQELGNPGFETAWLKGLRVDLAEAANVAIQMLANPS